MSIVEVRSNQIGSKARVCGNSFSIVAGLLVRECALMADVDSRCGRLCPVDAPRSVNEGRGKRKEGRKSLSLVFI
jgi:hypothetical protein